ncbi:hypothetical protein AA313_de0210139 [Arthrobotrys entomopaga]|nr:hypothetical protein AA313_de0210139 [Arthrobotrys entomopaga]
MRPTVFNLITFITSVRQRLNSTTTSLVAMRRVGCHFFRHDAEVGKDQDKKQIAAKLNVVYGDLVKVVDAAKIQGQSFPTQVENVYQKLATVHADVQSFFTASKDLSDQCRTVEAKLIAADRVRALCLRINNAVGPFEAVLDQLGVHADAVGAADNLKALGRVDSAVEFTSKILDAAVFAGISSLLNSYFKFSDIDQPMIKLSTNLGKDFDTHLSEYEAELAKLITLVEPSKTTTYTLPTVEGKPPSPVFALDNPLMDDATANSFSNVFQEILNTTGPNNVKTKAMSWTKPTRKDPLVIEEAYLQAWGAKWDAVETNNPSAVWISWYTQKRLDQLMDARNAWQPKATAGGVSYRTAIQVPLQKPLQDRIHQLLQGVVQLQGDTGSADILKKLPPPVPEQQPTPVPWQLPVPAMDLIILANPDVLQLYMAAAGAFYAESKLPVSAGADALTGIHHDYNLIEARKLLEFTSNGTTAIDFAKLAKSDQGLGS